MSHRDGIGAALLWVVAFLLGLAAIVGEPFQGVLARVLLGVLAAVCVVVTDCDDWPQGVSDPADERWHYNKKSGRVE